MLQRPINPPVKVRPKHKKKTPTATALAAGVGKPVPLGPVERVSEVGRVRPVPVIRALFPLYVGLVNPEKPFCVH